LIESLLKDFYKLIRTDNLQNKLKDLNQVFEDYRFEKLVEIFKD
jgi:hypothetical protein